LKITERIEINICYVVDNRTSLSYDAHRKPVNIGGESNEQQKNNYTNWKEK
jgi:hypothetical protein